MRTRAIPAAKPGTAADITYRQHAITESVIADVIDGPFGSSTKQASSPAGTFTASPSPWVSVAKLDDVSGRFVAAAAREPVDGSDKSATSSSHAELISRRIRPGRAVDAAGRAELEVPSGARRA